MDDDFYFNETWNGNEFGRTYNGVSHEVHVAIGCLLIAVGTAGILGNGVVLFVFTRFRRLRGPFSSFIVNLAVADLTTSILHIMAVISSFKGRWVFGKVGCMIYACGVGHFGLLSIVTLAAIAVERYMVITAKPLSGSWKITQYGARKVCVFAWIYCFSMSLPPLFGWSRYIPEGFLTSCSWDYMTRTPANRAYYIYLLTLGFVIPVSVIAYCYTFVLTAILAHGKEMANVKATGGGGPVAVSLTSRLTVSHSPTNSTIRTAEIILMLVILFLVSWTPYAIVTLIGQFGDPKLITPWVSALPAFFAKASVVYNPIVYGLSHPHFRSSIKQYVSACTKNASNPHTTSSMRRPTTAGKRPLRAAASSPVADSKIRHVHFTYYPRKAQSADDFHCDPKHKAVTLLLEQPRGTAVSLHFDQGTAGTTRISTTLLPQCNQLGGSRLQSTGFTSSDGIVADSSSTPPSARAAICLLYETPTLQAHCRHVKSGRR